MAVETKDATRSDLDDGMESTGEPWKQNNILFDLKKNYDEENLAINLETIRWSDKIDAKWQVASNWSSDRKNYYTCMVYLKNEEYSETSIKRTPN